MDDYFSCFTYMLISSRIKQDTTVYTIRQVNDSTMQAQVAYCKHSDLRMIKGDITFDLCMSINNVLPRQAVCAQKLKSVWAVRLQNAEAVKTLLRRGVTIQGSQIDFYPVNPFNHDNSSSERVVIKDLPFWEPDSLVSDFMKTFQQITTCSDVVLSKAKNNITNGTSNFYNGDRLVFTNANFYPPLPLTAQIGGYTCRIRHASQTRNCIRCQTGSHRTDDPGCPARIEPSDDIFPFAHGIFSNFFKCPIIVGDMKFPSSEHYYQWRACTEALRDDLAEQVYKAETPRLAKIIAGQVKQDPKWHQSKYDVMKDVLRAKLRCSQLFRDELIKSGDKLLVEARLDDYWGSGLTMSITATTNPKNYPGSNKLGQLLGELRRELKNNQLQDEETNMEPMDVAAAASNTDLTKADLSMKESTSHDGQVDKSLAQDALTQPVPSKVDLTQVDLEQDELTPDNSQQSPDPTSVSDSQDDTVSPPTKRSRASRPVAKVGSQFRSYSISPSRLNDIKLKDNPIAKAFMKQQLKRQRESNNSRDNPDTASVCMSTDSFTSAIDKASDIAVIRDFEDQVI